jgi:hypothetical protein
MDSKKLEGMSNAEIAAAAVVHVHDGPECTGGKHDKGCKGFEVGCHPLPLNKFVCPHLPVG